MDAIGRRPSRPLPTDPSVYSLVRRPPAVTVHHLPMLSALFSCGGVMTFRARGPHPMPNHVVTLDAESGNHTRWRVSQSWPTPELSWNALPVQGRGYCIPSRAPGLRIGTREDIEMFAAVHRRLAPWFPPAVYSGFPLLEVYEADSM